MPVRANWLGETRATLALAAPLAAAQLALIALNIVDTVLMGWLAPAALAAGTLAQAIFYVPWLFGFGVLNAVAALVADARGGGRPLVIRRTAAKGLVIATLIGVPATLALWPTEYILTVFGQDAESAALAQTYMRPLLFSLLPAMWFVALRSFIAAMGHARAVLLITLAGVAVNALAAWALMFGRLGLPALGLPGAGIATTLVYLVMVASALAYIRATPALARFRILARPWRGDRATLARVLRVGLPIGGTLLAEVGLFSVGSLLVGQFGAISLAAHAIALMLASIAFMLPLGIGQAATIRVGLALGAGDARKVAAAGWVAYGLGVAVSTVALLMFWLMPKPLLSLFLDLGHPDAAAVIELGVTFLAIAALFQLMDGAQAIGQGVLRGLQDTAAPMAIAVFGYWGVGLTAAVLLAFAAGLGGPGVWVGQALGLSAVALLLIGRFALLARRGMVGP